MTAPAAAGQEPIAVATALVDSYRQAGERSMRDLPIYNDALSVEAIGFRLFDNKIMGIIVTPWFMNVVLVPLDDSMSDNVPGYSLKQRFPVGLLEFNVGEIAPIGRIASCSLFSPMFEFGDMAAARATAEACLIELMTAAPAEYEEAEKPRKLAAAVDRRNFLRGALTEPQP
jgi:[NiFe] hydrogenase assembly HybE family chaperone